LLKWKVFKYVEIDQYVKIVFLAKSVRMPPCCWLHLIVVRRFEYASNPESYTSSSVATGRASHAGKFKG